MAGRIEIRQRPLEHDRRPFAGGPVLHLPDDRQQLFLAVPPSEVTPPGRRIRRREADGPAGLRRNRYLLEPRQQILEPLPITGPEQRRRRHDVESGEVGQAGQQIEIPRPQAIAAGRPVGYGHHHLPHRAAQPPLERQPPHPVLVDPPGGRDPPLVGPEHPGEKPRLPQHAPGAAIEVPARLEGLDQHPFEGFDLPLVPAQLVVQPQKLVDQPRTQLERRLHPRRAHLLGRRPPAHETLDAVQPRRGIPQAPMQLGVQLVAGHHAGQHHGGPPRQQALLEGPPQLIGRRARRHEHHRRAQIPGPGPVEAVGDRTAERREIRRPEQPDPARSSHGSRARGGVRGRSTCTTMENLCIAYGGGVNHQWTANIFLPEPRTSPPAIGVV